MTDCWLTNRDLLTPVQGMVAKLHECDGVSRIVIVDCGSTYQPLLDWYDGGCSVEVMRIENKGHLAPWGVLTTPDDFYFVSDADFDLSETPKDFLCVLIDGLQRHVSAMKAGLSQRIDDLPDGSPIRQDVLDNEREFWKTKADEQFYWGRVDTTPAVYRPRQPWLGYGPSLISAPPYSCRHLSWHLTPDALSEEWRYYMEHLDPLGIVWGAKWQQKLRSS